ncbi:MAG: 4-hydroxy-3-methylbut-2-en-1-yl diphosphate synthase [Verrucomicrobia bacterium]|nr:MAG: 4-hydroxy-3-methylbut-2-en-1-yl diphosphate synthase [Verrucomicrobiota bacterium]PYK47062.1 MAG: 4-hydroxy-3-methylbut-2-en-1-yl diphosphate synthase [Verrucomicrobiota bacterium]
MNYCSNPLQYHRRATREVNVGNVGIGNNNPIRVQSMITCDTMDTEASIQQTVELAEAGCEIVRITAPTVKDARNLEHIVKGLRERGCDVPIVADIHFKPEAAMEAAKWVEKVRINPGNYADSKKFAIREYTDEQYADELSRIRERFSPLVELCKRRGTAMRIGTNHGSLSDRILNRYGDTPLGMVESALEFARIARDLDYHEFVFSMKASNPKVMIAAYRLLVARLNELGPGWEYPLHLGVTEAGEGEDARIKSAIGIGSLLGDGIGDTIRVSLTEDSPHEIPVANALIQNISRTSNAERPTPNVQLSFDPFSYQRRATEKIELNGVKLGGGELIRVVVRRANFDKIAHKVDRMGDYKPEIVYEDADIREVDPRDDIALARINQSSTPEFVSVRDDVQLSVIAAFRLLAAKLQARHPILLKDVLSCRASVSDAKQNNGVSQKRPTDFLNTLLTASTTIGSLLCDGIGDAILVQGEEAPGQALRLSYNILQAAGSRIFKTDYVACPSCGRTLFNLQTTTAKIKAATSHLKGVKIAIMGCIVNGPGEMADADFGYVGGAPGKVNLYVGKTAVKFNIPEGEAVDRLKDLIREHGKWMEPAQQTVALEPAL